MPNKTNHSVGSGNVFVDLGVPNPKEALAKADIAAQICRIIAASDWTAAQAADRLGIGLIELAQLQRGGHDRFSFKQIRQFLDALGQSRRDGRHVKTRASRNPMRPRATGRRGNRTVDRHGESRTAHEIEP